MQGQTGPHANYPGFGNTMGALCGFYHMSGYSDGEMAPPYGAYTDYVVPRMAAFALLGAIDYRSRTGRGQYIDLSQYEAALHFLSPVLIDYMSSGVDAVPQGNWSERYAPHGAYRFADDGEEERWVTIAVENDDQWEKLLAILGEHGDPRFRTIVNRVESSEALDTYLQEIVRRRDARPFVMDAQAKGIGVYPVQNCLDLHSDENLVDFGFWRWLEQEEVGVMPYDGLAYRLDRTGSDQKAAPSLGADTDAVLGELLGMKAAEIARLKDAEVLM
jgi:benzylsuccinate CoA-transferase BbsF subunit